MFMETSVIIIWAMQDVKSQPVLRSRSLNFMQLHLSFILSFGHLNVLFALLFLGLCLLDSFRLRSTYVWFVQLQQRLAIHSVTSLLKFRL